MPAQGGGKRRRGFGSGIAEGWQKRMGRGAKVCGVSGACMGRRDGRVWLGRRSAIPGVRGFWKGRRGAPWQHNRNEIIGHAQRSEHVL